MMFDVALEVLRAAVLLGLMIFLWRAGRDRSGPSQRGWGLVIGGFGLLLFGSLLDISDNFQVLDRFVVIGDTEAEAFLEKFVGFLGGFVVLAVGLVRWVPSAKRTAGLQDTNADLEAEIALRKQTEQALRASEQRLARAQQLAKIGYWGWSLGDQGMHYVSREYAEILGLAPDDVPKNQAEFNRFIHPEDRARVEAYFHDVTTEPQDYEIAYRIIRSNGEVRHVVEIGELAYDDDGLPTGHTGTIQDITERRQAEEAVYRSETRAMAAEQRLLDAVERISDGFVLFDSEDRLVLCNANWKQFHGYSDADAAAGTGYEDLLRRDVELGTVAGEGADYLRRRIAYRRRPEESLDVHLADGRWVTIRERRTSDGGTVGIESDITERKRAEEAIRESEQRFRGVVDNSPSAIFLTDMEGRYRLVNKRFEEWFGLCAEDALGRTSHDIFPIDHADAYTAQDREVLETGEVISREHEIPFADGRDRLIVVTKFPVFESEGRPVGVGTISTDVTDLKQSDAALLAAKVDAELANRAKSEFLANMSHELRTPLNVIIGFAELIGNELLGPVGTDQYRDHAQDIAESGRRLLGLIDNILDLSKIEAGKVDLYEQDIDMSEAIRSSLILAGGRANHEGVKLESNTPEALPRLHADERMLKQVLISLLSNAVKFTPTGGRVTVRAWAGPETGYVVQVSDTGIGMRLEDIPKAMVRFGQIDGRLDRKFEGTGLGLPLSKSLVELHGGTLDLDSEPGVGTVVTVRFPADRIVGPRETRSRSGGIHKAAS